MIHEDREERLIQGLSLVDYTTLCKTYLSTVATGFYQDFLHFTFQPPFSLAFP